LLSNLEEGDFCRLSSGATLKNVRYRIPDEQAREPCTLAPYRTLNHPALEPPSREHEAFLEIECRGDEDLRLELQSFNLGVARRLLENSPAGPQPRSWDR
jgi:hypothetical protein